MYAHVMKEFKGSKDELSARSMYAKLMKKLSARAFNDKRLVSCVLRAHFDSFLWRVASYLHAMHGALFAPLKPF